MNMSATQPKAIIDKDTMDLALCLKIFRNAMLNTRNSSIPHFAIKVILLL